MLKTKTYDKFEIDDFYVASKQIEISIEKADR